MCVSPELGGWEKNNRVYVEVPKVEISLNDRQKVEVMMLFKLLKKKVLKPMVYSSFTHATLTV